ncbi:hypothetical protein FRB90_001879 [Tulasnella sp. 427]|nr:hypothetical protein FRB90_001879 [Tulasnella sp. 427]
MPFRHLDLAMWRWLSAYIVLTYLHTVAQAGLVNVTVHSTNPQIQYAPETSCRGNKAGGCGVRFEPWELTTYTTVHNRRYSFHQVDSWGNEPSSETMRRRFSFRFTGSAIYVYGAPRDYLSYPPGRQEICLDGNCEVVNGGDKYESSGTEPVLLWSSGDLGSSHAHLLELRLLDNGNGWGWWPMTGTSFQHLVYTKEPTKEPPPYRPANGTALANVTLHDTNYAIQYEPREAWKQSTFSALNTPRDTFHYSSNEGSHPESGSFHQVSFEMQGAAIYVYGASEDALRTIEPKPYIHAPIDVCLDDECHPIDVHQAYLDSTDDEHLPILLWSYSGLSPEKTTFVHIRMLSGESAAGVVRRSNFERVVYTELRPMSPIVHPIERGIYHKKRVLYDAVDRFPLFRWKIEAGASGSYGSVLNEKWYGKLPQWSYSAQGYGFRIYGPPLESMRNLNHAAQRICLNQNYCHYIDVGHIYMSIPNSYEDLPVLIWSIDGLDPFTKHAITAEMVDHFYDQDKRVMALSHVETLWVEVPAAPPPPPPPKPSTSNTPTKTASPTQPSTAQPTTTTVFVTLIPQPDHGTGYHVLLIFTGISICVIALLFGYFSSHHLHRVRHYMPLNGGPHPNYGTVGEENASEQPPRA